jgi:hypothetical protein
VGEKMSNLKVVSYDAANGGDYDKYVLSDGRTFYLWLKNPFYSSNEAIVHIMTTNDKEIGTAIIIKDIDNLIMVLNGRKVTAEITINQFLRPNKKYYFDKIVKHLL